MKLGAEVISKIKDQKSKPQIKDRKKICVLINHFEN